jgi:hypothetical protein
MSIVKWTVSPFNTPPSRQEYSHETAKFYMHARGRGRDAKDSTWTRYFDTEAEALEYIRQRSENKAAQRRVDQINRCGVQMLEALEAARDLWGDYLPPGNSNAMKAMRLVDAAIAKAKGLA